MNADAIREGSYTPWGGADFVTHPAPGVVVVSTPSHGGIGLDSIRNGMIAEPWRNASGWYEEDCEALIVAARFPEILCRTDDHHQQCLDQLRYWYPEIFAEIYYREDQARAGQETHRDWERDYAARKAAARQA